MYLHSWIAILFACIALYAGSEGIDKWDRLNRSQKWITLFCAGSGVLQMIQSWMRYLHAQSGPIGHIWTSWSILTLLSSGVESSKRQWRPTMRKIQFSFLAFWIVYYFHNPEFFSIGNGPHMVLTSVTMMFGCAVLLTAMDAPFSDSSVAGIWIAGGMMLGQGADLFCYAETLGWLGLNLEGFKTLIIFRNSVWVFAYLFFLRAVLCTSSFPSSLPRSR